MVESSPPNCRVEGREALGREFGDATERLHCLPNRFRSKGASKLAGFLRENGCSSSALRRAPRLHRYRQRPPTRRRSRAAPPRRPGSKQAPPKRLEGVLRATSGQVSLTELVPRFRKTRIKFACRIGRQTGADDMSSSILREREEEVGSADGCLNEARFNTFPRQGLHNCSASSADERLGSSCMTALLLSGSEL